MSKAYSKADAFNKALGLEGDEEEFTEERFNKEVKPKLKIEVESV